MQALRVRLVGLGASLVLVLTGIGGMGTALAQYEVNVAAACNNVAFADRGGANAQSVNVAQGNYTEANDFATAVGGTNAACVPIAAQQN
jgi:hypothetical protein